MNNVSSNIQSKLKSLATAFVASRNEAKDVERYYFASNASTLVPALATDVSPATMCGLSKAQFLSGVSTMGIVKSFFGNAAVSTSDWMYATLGLIGGAYPKDSVLSADVEAQGVRMKLLAVELIKQYKLTAEIVEIYSSSELSAAAGAMSAHTVMFGASMTKQHLVDGIVMCQQFLKIFDNAAVTTGDYASTAEKWAQFE